MHSTQATAAKPGPANSRLQADQTACLEQSVGQLENTWLPTWGQTINREAYDDCMRRRGYDADAAAASPRR